MNAGQRPTDPAADSLASRLTCADAFRRERHLVARVTRAGTHVALRVPPGELALLTLTETRSLSDYLTHLADRIASTAEPPPAS